MSDRRSIIDRYRDEPGIHGAVTVLSAFIREKGLTDAEARELMEIALKVCRAEEARDFRRLPQKLELEALHHMVQPGESEERK